MNSEMKSERSVLRNMSIDSCPCIPRVTSVLSKTATIWARKICAYVQSEIQVFSDIQEDSTVEQHTDPAFIAYIKGEIPEPAAYCRRTMEKEKCESYHLKKTTREKTGNKVRRAKKHTPNCQKSNLVGRKPDLLMKPPPVEELVFRKRRSFISAEKVSQGSTKPPCQESPGKNKIDGEHHIHDCLENCTPESATRDSINSQIGKEKITHLRLPGILLVVAVVNALLRVVEKFCAYVKREWTEVNDIYSLESADVQCTEPAFIAYVKGEDTAPYIS